MEFCEVIERERERESGGWAGIGQYLAKSLINDHSVQLCYIPV